LGGMAGVIVWLATTLPALAPKAAGGWAGGDILATTEREAIDAGGRWVRPLGALAVESTLCFVGATPVGAVPPTFSEDAALGGTFTAAAATGWAPTKVDWGTAVTAPATD